MLEGFDVTFQQSGRGQHCPEYCSIFRESCLSAKGSSSVSQVRVIVLQQ